ncbi:MAG TPA: YceI family protein [Thermoanaerobaculia bacterium]|nr:YceI family protein [Thermoanaerobaculia bacterium]HQR67806.1 YceI family protein [Thermoanaerobaculia bacterium]
MRRSLVPAVLILLAAGAPAVAAGLPAGATGTWSVDTSHSKVGFEVRHFVADVKGRFNDFSGVVRLDAAKPEACSVELTVKVASVDTFEPQRDAHLREPDFFDAARHPEIRFVSRKVARRSDTEWEVTGDLTMKGVTKEVLLPVTFKGITRDSWERERAVFEASLTLNRQDYGLNWSRLFDQGGFVMADDVAVSIRLEATRPTPAAK